MDPGELAGCVIIPDLGCLDPGYVRYVVNFYFLLSDLYIYVIIYHVFFCFLFFFL